MLEPAAVSPQQIRPLRRVEYEQLVVLGAFDADRVELIHGNLVTMAPNDPEHASAIEILTAILGQGIGSRASLRVQLPIIAAEDSVPEPDLALVPNGSYSKRHPDSARLIIEVAASSLKKDRGVKAPLFAKSGFAEYWIVNVAEQCVEVFRAPTNGVYLDVTKYGVDTTLSPLAFPDLEVHVAALVA